MRISDLRSYKIDDLLPVLRKHGVKSIGVDGFSVEFSEVPVLIEPQAVEAKTDEQEPPPRDIDGLTKEEQSLMYMSSGGQR